jgi:ubiquinone/menaquinone biosynthesis C-methylase UbiE
LPGCHCERSAAIPVTGAGRPLVQEGIRMVGLDISPPMLSQVRAKSKGYDRKVMEFLLA